MNKTIEKKKVDFIFIVLCYKNTIDLKSFIESVSNIKDSYKIIVVNNFYDESTNLEFQEISKKNDCDFLSFPNKGYGFGNNRGIEFANKMYSYEYLIISNPDIKFDLFEKESLKNMTECIVAPQIKTLSGKMQNPFMNYNVPLVEYLEYKGHKKKSNLLLYSGYGINKIIREISILKNKIKYKPIRKTYAAHGAFIIFGYKALQILQQPFDESMFLFSEEFYLAKLARKKNISIYLNFDIKITHKEDGSMSLVNNSINKMQAESFIKYYEKEHKINS